MLSSMRRWSVAYVSFLCVWRESYLMEKMARMSGNSLSLRVCVFMFDLLGQANNCLSPRGRNNTGDAIKNPSRLRGKISVNSYNIKEPFSQPMM